ncbi:PREDICTED: uncharacterized protein LOC108565358 [Nicrophorus vespilloides]|uniref:Uncharacterized protein LOC108565358 n=1 Tax=Nicrophorus vespilloides TaxID=110193 RepID=A0ABM1N0C0_NICVS|nr:PREDICTED: uncharacterized protein LOC108565358 [Nicrophorus vespilloides]
MIKLLVFGLALTFQVVHPAVLPERVSASVCKKSSEDYTKCLLDAFEHARPYFVSGVPELDFPGIDPLIINVTSVDRTLNELVSIKAVMRDVRVTGLKGVIIDDLKADIDKMVGEIRLTVPRCEMSMEHDVTGQLLIIPLRSRGLFKGNFTNIQMYMRAQFKRFEKDGIEFFAIDKFDTKFRVGDGVIKIVSKNPQLQFSADLITNFYNENPRLVMDAINPIFNDYSNKVIRQEIDNYLAKVPADEFLPE